MTEYGHFDVFVRKGGWFGGDKGDGQEYAWVKLREQGYAVAAAGEDRAVLTVLQGAEHGDSMFETAENMGIVRAFMDKYLKEK